MIALQGKAAAVDRAQVEPPGGYILGAEFRLPMRVYYEDTDAGGIVYHANYLKFAERARTEMLRVVGVNQTNIRKDYDLLFAVRSCTVEYLRPAMLDDGIEVRTRVTRIGGASVEILQDVWRDDGCLAKLTVRIACLNSSGQRPMRMPQAVQAALKRFESETMATSVGGS
ncbi:tol-pal system-associated acyl-CoA thioesterase [Pelagibius sp. Alg239-R121]|uniref:tol-pal system-associated acyl-CoA thioesterase n=1 Tax=Pelagibius sp. Alg239-R121 TaxID=2993448 RepID=UPI0024A72393|nr:tol-pal system-associated acyl-CoA thioesterase [Pelagibius sp. Alg239-R121]